MNDIPLCFLSWSISFVWAALSCGCWRWRSGRSGGQVHVLCWTCIPQIIYMGWVDEKEQDSVQDRMYSPKFLALRGSSLFKFSAPPVSCRHVSRRSVSVGSLRVFVVEPDFPHLMLMSRQVVVAGAGGGGGLPRCSSSRCIDLPLDWWCH